MPGARDIRLFSFRRAPSALKVRLALSELGIDYELIEVNLFNGDHLTEQFGRLNPFHRVPVLQVGKFRLRESAAILTYLGKRAQKYWPEESLFEAIAAQWLFFEAEHLSQQCIRLWWSERVAPATGLKGAGRGRLHNTLEELKPALKVVEATLRRSEFMLGAKFTLVDCAYAATLAMLMQTSAKIELYPGICAYVNRMRRRPSWKLGDADALHDFRGIKGPR